MTLASKRNSGFRKLREVFSDTHQQVKDGEMQLVAASLSYSTIFALIPFFAVVLAILQYMGGGFDVIYPKVEALILRNFNEALGDAAAKSLRKLLRSVSFNKLGVTGALGLVFTSLRLLYDMEVGIHRVWNEKNTRPLYKRLFFYWMLMLATPFALAFYVSLNSLREADVIGDILLPLFSGYTLLALGLFMIFKWVPTAKVRWRPALISSVITAFFLVITQKVFAWAAVTLFTYSKIYGGFAAIPLLLFWIYILWHVVLGGVALCASLHKRQLA